MHTNMSLLDIQPLINIIGFNKREKRGDLMLTVAVLLPTKMYA